MFHKKKQKVVDIFNVRLEELGRNKENLGVLSKAYGKKSRKTTINFPVITLNK